MRLERFKQRSLAVRFVVAALLAVLGLSAVGSGSALAGKREWSVIEDHPYLVGTDPVTRQRTLDEIQKLGADTIRVEVKWNEVAPDSGSKKHPTFDATNPSAYPGFGPYDDLVTRATAMGFRIVITITGDAPRWASAAGGANYKPDPGEYAKFAAAVAARYSGAYSGLPKVLYFTIWNEPNHVNFIKPQSQAALIYRKLVDQGVPAIRRNAAPAAKVFVGELKPTPAKGSGPKRFIQDWLCLDANYRKLRGAAARRHKCKTFHKVDADGFAHHPYGPTQLIPKKADIINLLAIRNLGKILDLAAKAKRLPRGLPIYDTEFGIQTNPPDVFVSTSPTRQAAQLNEKEWLSYRYARLKSYSQYQIYDDPPRPGPAAARWSGFQTGLRFYNGRTKPSYESYKFPIVVKKLGRKVSIWGRVRPGAGIRYAQLQKASGGGYKNSGPRLRTNSFGYFTAKRATGKYRFVAYENPSGGSPARLSISGHSRTAKASG